MEIKRKSYFIYYNEVILYLYLYFKNMNIININILKYLY